MSETRAKAQVFFSVAAGKQLIAEGLASRADIQEALREHTVVVIMGTTNGCLAEELLKLKETAKRLMTLQPFAL